MQSLSSSDRINASAWQDARRPCISRLEDVFELNDVLVVHPLEHLRLLHQLLRCQPRSQGKLSRLDNLQKKRKKENERVETIVSIFSDRIERKMKTTRS